ncbi:MAG: permease [Candidatus Omnitrophica bacterium]|nr:permease [Candidatus Omnitrophota bacterium]MDD4941435.1 permease [Candidatus Omnitrophota bacterium]MDD5774646.1 permease [Candidatus Omnitrophota bacterium]HQO37685.1 permease [Candidatus Omnitrophota bacterium]HQQ05972.1 permease [Candidatus Omnitrophota bacterium]
MSEWKKLLYIAAAFAACFYLPVESLRFNNAVLEALALVKWYAREHVLLCLIPAFFIAGAISVFVSQASVMKYFGRQANKFLSYSVAAVSGTVLAVCSCTVLPLFSGIYKRGAGLGPASAFLYSGPAINVLAIILTARILGWQLGLGRAVGAIVFSVVIGLLMHLIFYKEECSRQQCNGLDLKETAEPRSLGKTVLYFAAMVAFLVFANLARPLEGDTSAWAFLYLYKWWIAGFALVSLALMLFKWFKKDELQEWTSATWGFALQILPLLLMGVLISGFLLGRVGHEGIIPSRFVESLVGGNSLAANFFASVVGAFMYFATLTEVPILQGLIGAGMGKGPALALLLAGPALSLPSMLVLRSVMGWKKTAVYVALVVIMATTSGMIFGFIVK